ncbi:penicillin-binding protein 1A [Edaphobacter sp. 12200R-103]|uniref:penicillin-binding protein 1A n=1 Tax=Edaphobacter sp. 12200R-103 TaxID=2703788 RepID=UPI00138BF68C|nr:transglycosylase domain-containing protein [Edaphobacter sp. 12200R-103]QHS51463.1 penicillin-binding protein [Edaphobacter sp. 12200R-103]
MPVKLKYGSNKSNSRQSSIVEKLHLDNRFVRYGLVLVLGCFLVALTVLGYYYFKYENIVNDRLAKGPLFANVSQIYATPREVRDGQKLSTSEIAAELRKAGYNSNPQLGTFQLNGDSIFIKPGPESYHTTDGATISAPNGIVQKITGENGAALSAYELEPQLITALSEDSRRTKRLLVSYQDIPPRMVQAVTAIEDRNFFEHNGINFLRIVKCGVEDLMSGRKRCGGSTLTMQLARGFFLSPEKHLKRKMIEILITFQLESRFSKQQIFEMYANQMNLGYIGSYDINGFGEASRAFFGKNLGQLDTAECAMLAGLLQNPSYRNPYRHPQRAIARRNVVLDSMVETGAITASEATRAKAEPLHLAPPNIEARQAPYFVDLVHEQLVKRISDQDLAHQSLRIYTSLDPDLQRAASEAVEVGMKNVDELVRKRYARRKDSGPITYPQVALVALNPHTGQILALVGGRNYSASQLNHAIAQRPTGSIFKPFVFASAFNTSLNGTNLDDNGPFTAVSKINDDPQDFGDNGKPYIPGNFVKGEYPGMVTAADALAHSLNIATIALAQKVGYGNVAALARSAGIVNARPTPSMAIGTYNATPIDMAGAYTIFANGGVHINPWMLASVRNTNGDIVSDFSSVAKQIIDPRVAFLTQSLMEGVMNFGTGAAVRARGFSAPAAGKTGTEHDAWFAGYTSTLLCVVWVGNDDYTDIKVQGADAAAPIWAEFMKRAIKLPQYSDVKPFAPPDGITIVKVDRDSGLLADPTCSVHTMNAAFLDGTAPTGSCSQMHDNPQNFFQKLFGVGGHNETVSPYTPAPATSPANTAVPLPAHPSAAKPANSASSAEQTAKPEEPKKKRNFFQKLFGGGGDKDKKDKGQEPPR